MQTREKNFQPAGQKAYLITAGNANDAAPQQARWYVTGSKFHLTQLGKILRGDIEI